MECGRWKRTWRCLRCCGNADREVRRRGGPYQGVRIHRQGEHAIDAGMPESFNVLVKGEIRSGLVSNVELKQSARFKMFKEAPEL